MKVGILGGGQLARMLALAGYPLGIHTVCLDPTADVCAAAVTNVICAEYTDEKQLAAFAAQVDVVTFESENIPVATIEFIQQIKPVYPPIEALKIGQDRWLEKNLFQELNIATPPFAAINTFTELEQAIETLGFPAVLKTRRFGYDGKGQMLLKTPDDLMQAWTLLGTQPLILEKFITFDREVSLIAVRDYQGATRFYPLVENQHRDGILQVSKAPFKDAVLQQQAENYLQIILNKLDYVGVLVIELFQVGQQLLANELAPRVHNSGHWTIEGAATSQFANHLRAICGLPLGDTTVSAYSAMFNIIGQQPSIRPLLSMPAVHYHTYEKAAKAKRKLGHVTLVATDKILYEQQLQQLSEILSTK